MPSLRKPWAWQNSFRSTGNNRRHVWHSKHSRRERQIRSAVRRCAVSETAYKKEAPKNRLPLADVFLDLDSQCIVRNEAEIALTYTEFKILELLIKNRKHIFSLDAIYSGVWDEAAVGDGAIMVHIKNIRKKLGDDSRNPRYIKTAWGRGYYVE